MTNVTSQRDMKRVILGSLLPVLLACGFSTRSFAQDEQLERLSPEHRVWLEEEVVYIILEREREVFLSLETVAERNSFIEAFWRKRDPNSATPENEFQVEHYRRFEYANKFLGRETFLPGWKTDRGEMYILLGEPVEIQNFDGYNDIREVQLWFYQGDVNKALPSFFRLVFFKRYDVGAYELYNPQVDGPNALVQGGRGNLEAIEALEILQRASYELAQASLALDTSEPFDFINATPSMGSALMMARIYDSPKRAIRPDYAEAWLRDRDRVSAEYSFNFVASRSFFAVLEGPDETPFVNYSVEIDPQDFTIETDEDQSKFYTTLDVSVEVTNEEGEVVLVHDRADYVELSPSQLQEVGAFPFSYQSNFPLLPGQYMVSVILRNRVSKQYTVAETSLVVPPLSSDNPRLSDVILGYSVEELLDTEALGERKLRTFQVGDACVRPAADGVFALGETIHVFFQALGAAPDSQLHFALLDGEKVLQERTTTLSTHFGGAIIERFPLRGMFGGRYSFRVRLLDPAGGLLAERIASCDVSPRTAIDRPWVRRRSFITETPGLLPLARGDQFVAAGNLAEAKVEFEKSMASAGPELPMARWKLALISIDTGDPARALELLTPIELEFANQYEVVAGLGLSYSLQGDCSKGIGYLERAKMLRPPDTNLLNMLGTCHRKLGDNQKAADAFQRSLDLNPEQEVVQELLASVKND